MNVSLEDRLWRVLAAAKALLQAYGSCRDREERRAVLSALHHTLSTFRLLLPAEVVRKQAILRSAADSLELERRYLERSSAVVAWVLQIALGDLEEE